MRIVQVLTDKVLPTPELVDKFRNLYKDRSQDVRLLIPVLNGMKKQEVIQGKYLSLSKQYLHTYEKKYYFQIISHILIQDNDADFTDVTLACEESQNR